MQKPIFILSPIITGAFLFSPYLGENSRCFAQGISINTTGTTGNSSALLDIGDGNSTSGGDTKGLLIPRVALTSNTDVVTVPSPATSLMVYNTNASMTNGSGTGYYYWDGAKWTPIAMTSSSGGPCAPTTITNPLDGTNNPCSPSSCGGTSRTLITCTNNCDNLIYGGYSDWRMPTTEELMNLIPLAPSNDRTEYVWTVSPVDNFYYSRVELGNATRSYDQANTVHFCRCVR